MAKAIGFSRTPSSRSASACAPLRRMLSLALTRVAFGSSRKSSWTSSIRKAGGRYSESRIGWGVSVRSPGI